MDHTNNQLDLILEMQRQAEERLRSLQQLAVAADARAMQFAAACIAAAAVLVAVSTRQEFWWASIATAVLFLLAAATAYWSAKPADWESYGYAPKDFETDLQRDRPYFEVISEMLPIYDYQIAFDKKAMTTSADLMRRAVRCAFCAPAIGLIVQVLVIGLKYNH